MVTSTATSATGTRSARIAAMPCATPDHVAERIPPSSAGPVIASTMREHRVARGGADQRRGGERAHADLGGERQQDRHRQQGRRGEPHRAAVELRPR